MLYALHKDTIYSYTYAPKVNVIFEDEYPLSKNVHCRLAMYNCFTKKYFFYVKPGVQFRMDAAVEAPTEVAENGALY